MAADRAAGAVALPDFWRRSHHSAAARRSHTVKLGKLRSVRPARETASRASDSAAACSNATGVRASVRHAADVGASAADRAPATRRAGPAARNSATVPVILRVVAGRGGSARSHRANADDRYAEDGRVER